MKPIQITASSLSSSVTLSHIAMPVGPNCFIPQRYFIDCIFNDVKDFDETNVNFGIIYKQLRNWKSAWTYKCPNKPEEKFTRENLQIIMNHILGAITGNNKSQFSAQQAVQVSNKLNFTFSKNSSLPEPVLLYNFDNGIYLGLIGSESKSLAASLYVTYSQALSLSCDLALDIVHKTHILPSQVIVPFIITSWETIQVGCVYLVDDNYPCSSLLSRAFNLNSHDDIVELCGWVNALSKHCSRIIDSIPHVPRKFKKQKKSQPDEIDVVLNWEKYICKPVSSSSELSRAALSHLLGVFYKLWQSESLRDYIVFPAGVIGYPDEVTQGDFFEAISISIESFSKMKEQDMTDETFAYGHPFVLYEKLLEQDGWKRGDSIVSEDNYLKLLFIGKLKEVLDLILEAGIIHMDIRLCNMFYRYYIYFNCI